MIAIWHVPLLHHSQGMMKVAVCPDTCIFQLEKVPFNMLHDYLLYSLSGPEFSFSISKIFFLFATIA